MLHPGVDDHRSSPPLRGWENIGVLAWAHHRIGDGPRTPASAREHDAADPDPCTINDLGEVSDEAYPHRTTEGSKRTPVARGALAGPARPGYRPGQGACADRAVRRGAQEMMAWPVGAERPSTTTSRPCIAGACRSSRGWASQGRWPKSTPT